MVHKKYLTFYPFYKAQIKMLLYCKCKCSDVFKNRRKSSHHAGKHPSSGLLSVMLWDKTLQILRRSFFLFCITKIQFIIYIRMHICLYRLINSSDCERDVITISQSFLWHFYDFYEVVNWNSYNLICTL